MADPDPYDDSSADHEQFEKPQFAQNPDDVGIGKGSAMNDEHLAVVATHVA